MHTHMINPSRSLIESTARRGKAVSEHPRFARILRVAAIAALVGTTALAQEAPPDSVQSKSETVGETIELPSFQVTGKLVDPYNATESASTSRIVGLLLDTSATINVITPSLIADIKPNSMYDVAQYIAGVSPGRGSGLAGVSDRMTFRGFESFSRTIDNFSGVQIPSMGAPLNNFVPVFIDKIEVVMGPNAILSPTGAPGGTINITSKSPQFTRATDVSLQFGNFGANRFSIDTTGPLGDGKHMAYRAILYTQDTDTYTQGKFSNQAAATMFTYAFSPTSQLKVKWFGTYQKVSGVPAMMAFAGPYQVFGPDTVGGVTISNTPAPGFKYNGYNGLADWAYTIIRANQATFELNTALGDRINMRLGGAFENSDMNRLFGNTVNPIVEQFDPQTGAQISVNPIANPSAMPFVATRLHLSHTTVQVQNDFAGTFGSDSLSFQPVVGWAYTTGSTPDFIQVTTPNSLMPAADLAKDKYSFPPPANNSDFSNFNTNTSGSSGWWLQGYANARLGLKKRLFLTLGASRTWAGMDLRSYPYVNTSWGGGFTAGNPNGPVIYRSFDDTKIPGKPTTEKSHDAYNAGLLWKVKNNVSLYYSYSSNSALAANTPLWQAGAQNEFGVKANFFNNRLTVTANHFSIKQDNLSYQNPLFNSGQSTIRNLYIDLVSEGEELNVTGGITENISVIGSYTQMKLRDPFGRRVRNIPDQMANMLLSYRFNAFNSGSGSRNANVSIGVMQQGKVAGETIAGFTPLGIPQQPGFYLAGYSVVNASAGLRLGTYSFNLNINNVLNSKFWYMAQSRSSVTPYSGANVTLSLEKRF